ncbi:MAG: TonB-dependent receptor [Lewinellaceae bacterium]|nr:TonB-dependent receptor [Lewinellaceae bacterium]
MKHTPYLFTLLLCLSVFSLFAQQKGSITGKIIDGKYAEALIGVSVRLNEGGGAVTDLDGNYMIANVPPGTYTLTLNYTGYQTKEIGGVVVKNGQATTLDATMEEYTAQAISEVVIVAKASRESMSALTILQKTSPTIADGISAEVIKRTPDRTTGEVIRRVSGASIQDNKFAVIRGLNDRYNIAMLNGAMLSSTEPDRKAFSFDLFPSAMLDNLVVMKTASADLPGEFAGGAIIINTKDIPEENYLSVSLSGGYNNVTTFKPHLSAQGGGTDWLGIDDDTRALPAGFPNTTDFKTSPKDERIRLSEMFPNDWAITEKSSTMPNTSLQVASGLVTDPQKNVQWGTTLAFSYSNSNRIQTAHRSEYDLQQKLQDFDDQQFKNNVLWGTLLNTALKFNNKHKLILQGTYSTNTDNIVNDRFVTNYEQVRYEKATSIEYTENHLLTTRLGGEHTLTESGVRLSWGGGFNRNTRDVPSLRRLTYFRNFDAEETDPYIAYIPFGSSTLNNGGRFYSSLSENVVNGNLDLTVPFALAGNKQSVKVGGLYQKKDRSFDARVLGYVRATVGGFNSSLTRLPQDSIFAPENIYDKGFLLDEITNDGDTYDANSTLSAAYVLFDNKIAEKLRISWGVRMERFNQQLNAINYSQIPVNIDRTTTDWLPSANVTYSLNDKHQLRLSASRTVTRPEFRELAPFAFYDFYLPGTVQGDTTLTSGTIYNYDLRYELYPGQNQLFSVSLFYKKFNNPVEFTFSSQGAGTRNFSFINVPSAENYGFEVEIRKNFDFINAGWESLVFFTNAAVIRSKINLEGAGAYDTDRALQGQSPYIVNVGLSHNWVHTGLNTTLVYNIIGDRVAQVGTDGYADIYERHRNLLDFQLSKRVWERGEIKLTWSDIFRPDFMYYQDNNADHKFNEDVDNIMQQLNNGSSITLGFSYRF